MKSIPNICMKFYRKLVVSCQAPTGDAFRDASCMARFAKAAVEGGAAGIRANGVEDIVAIRSTVSVPIIGIQKSVQPDGQHLITSTLEEARELVRAGADLVALDCTARGCRLGALERLRKIKSELNVPVMADIATVEEAVASAAVGADLVASTMVGYTPESKHHQAFEPSFIAELARKVDVPLVAEGRIRTPEQAKQAIAAGAFAVVIGTAITSPKELTRRFALMLERETKQKEIYFIGIDLGGTRTKSGVVSDCGELIASSVHETPSGGGREVLLRHLKEVAGRCLNLAHDAGLDPAAVGVATAGWVNTVTGQVAYATENLPGWTNTRIAEELEPELDLQVAVENDSNALAVAEKYFGAAKKVENFVCITLGTGVGGGAFLAGRLNHGAHFLASAVGHIPIEYEGRQCTCGGRGCLEAYTNGAALLRYADGSFRTAEELIVAANSGHPLARQAVEIYSPYLTMGISAIVHLMDPEMIILSGGIVQNNPTLLVALQEELGKHAAAWGNRQLKVCFSQLGYHAGVLGAAAVAYERLKSFEEQQ
jgi:putative N-acetylmannosamine-6-phosphate epimerase/predicted NBD/HSP70 family sugar kinase